MNQAHVGVIWMSLASWVEVMPWVWLVTIQIAMHHLRSGSFMSSKIVPTLMENRWRQPPPLRVRLSEKW